MTFYCIFSYLKTLMSNEKQLLIIRTKILHVCVRKFVKVKSKEYSLALNKMIKIHFHKNGRKEVLLWYGDMYWHATLLDALPLVVYPPSELWGSGHQICKNAPQGQFFLTIWKIYSLRAQFSVNFCQTSLL